tara:strand:+ start:844 stop:1002 length:159 start_codon:yes stop_codon:yes gene_type:complete
MNKARTNFMSLNLTEYSVMVDRQYVFTHCRVIYDVVSYLQTVGTRRPAQLPD